MRRHRYLLLIMQLSANDVKLHLQALKDNELIKSFKGKNTPLIELTIDSLNYFGNDEQSIFQKTNKKFQFLLPILKFISTYIEDIKGFFEKLVN